MNPEPNTANLLVIHQGALGDFIMTFPALLALRAVYAPLHVLCQRKLGALAGRLGLVEKSYPLESAAFAPLYGQEPERIGPRAAGILQDCGRIVLFSDSTRLRENLAKIAAKKVWCIPPRPPQEEKVHVADFLYDKLVAAGLLPDGKPNVVPHRRLRRRESRRILLHPGSGSRLKNWPLDNFIRLAQIFGQTDLRPEFILGPAEFHLEKELACLPAPAPPIHACDDLLEILARLESARGFIGNDSGLCHLAAFIGLPTVAVFGPSDPARWRPVGPAVAVVRSAFECSPCHESGPKRCAAPECFSGISPEGVYRAFYELVPRTA